MHHNKGDVLAVATARHITLCKHHHCRVASEPRRSASVGLVVDVEPDGGGRLAAEDTSCLTLTQMPEYEAPEPEDTHEEAPIPVLNRFSVLCIVYGARLRRMPSASAR